MSGIAAQLVAVSKAFGSRTVLNSVHASFESGTSTAITGASGSGKSTLLHCLGGLETIDAGRVVVSGVEVSDLSEPQLTRTRRDNIGYIFQRPSLLRDLTVLENTSFQGLLAGLAESVVKERAVSLLTRLGIEESFLSRLPSSLSGGEALRVTVARALVCEPKLLLADEPTGALDETNAQTVLAEILDLAHRADTALVIVTHDRQVATACDRELTMRDLNGAVAA